jgi:hypothetical protein
MMLTTLMTSPTNNYMRKRKNRTTNTKLKMKSSYSIYKEETLNNEEKKGEEEDVLADAILKNGKVTRIAHSLLRSCIREDDIVVDLTLGNGTDTMLFLELINSRKGSIFSFDIQREAIEVTKTRIREGHTSKNKEKRVHFIQDCHSKFYSHITRIINSRISTDDDDDDARARTKIELGAVTLNLGYLTGKETDKSIVTRTETTIKAIEQASELLRVGGIMTICCYQAHEGGKEETDAVIEFCSKLKPEITVSKINVINRAAPVLICCYRQR